MQIQSIDDIKSAIPQIVEQIPYLKLLVLLGSRARGDHDAESDWDFAVLYDEELRRKYEKSIYSLRIWKVLKKVLHLSEDKIDIVNLDQCSLRLKHIVAQDGEVIFEKEDGLFEEFHHAYLESNIELKAYRQVVREKVKSAL